MKNSDQNSTKSLWMTRKLAEHMTVQEILDFSGNFRQKLFVIWVVLIELGWFLKMVEFFDLRGIWEGLKMIHLPRLGMSIKRSLSISDMQNRAGTSLLNNDYSITQIINLRIIKKSDSLVYLWFYYTSFMPNKTTKCLIRLAIYVIIFLHDSIFATEYFWLFCDNPVIQ